MSMITDYLKDFDVATEANKQAFLEKLYIESGRTNGLFTGLYQEWVSSNQKSDEG